MLYVAVHLRSKGEGKDQDLIQSSTTPDPKYHLESDKSTRKHLTQESQEASPFPAGDHKTARNRQDSITKRRDINNKNDRQKKHRLGTVSNKSLDGLVWFPPLDLPINDNRAPVYGWLKHVYRLSLMSCILSYCFVLG